MLTHADSSTTNAIVLCLRLARARGRELRALREPALTTKDQADDESQFAVAMREGGDDEAQ